MGDNKILNFNMNQFELLRQNSSKAIEMQKEIEEKQISVDKLLNIEKPTTQQNKAFLSSVFDKKDLLEKTIREINKIEEIVYLLKLEIYQWKGQEEQYVDLSLDYFAKYSKIAPNYKKSGEKFKLSAQKESGNGVITIETSDNVGVMNMSNEVLKFHVKEINNQNLHYLTDYLNGKHSFMIFIDIKNVDYFSYEAGQELLTFFKTYRKDKDYIVNIKNPNKMIEIVFTMFGLNEFVTYT